MRRRTVVRLAVGSALVAVVVAIGYTGWLGWRVAVELSRAQQAVGEVRAALEARDAGSRERAIEDLRTAAARADDATDGLWWRMLGWLPAVGDDLDGVRVLSSSLHGVAGVAPSLGESLDLLEDVSRRGRINLEALERLESPVLDAERAFAAADAALAAQDSAGFAYPIQRAHDRFAAVVGDTSRALASGATAVRVLPRMFGADGPRSYLLMFQNNAEIRATGGMPGTYMLVRAENGRLDIVRQARAGEFVERPEPILPLTRAEEAQYGRQLGTYIQDAGFTPDFPRAAELTAARWQEEMSGAPLDGVMAFDPVAVSYLLEGTGPIALSNGTTLTAENAVSELLNRPYLDMLPAEQDAMFAEASEAIFGAVTGDVPSPLKLVSGFVRAAHEGRFLLADFDPTVEELIGGSRIRGSVARNDAPLAHVDIGLNDATGAKMSYYLRYSAEVEAVDCR
ncbi:DUF4012 domain-containing protein, partial [Nocardioides sp.]|uniref:DUF4012 domain-containing protein n=1 Tax=Nocardioides sp. TaxID=35761 RepID=UPI0035622DA3